jgi:hypothetical protein
MHLPQAQRSAEEYVSAPEILKPVDETALRNTTPRISSSDTLCLNACGYNYTVGTYPNKF